jgi:hypothetical protein
MTYALSSEQAKMHACSVGLILDGFTVAEDHSIVLCEQGKEWYHSTKRWDQRQSAENGSRERERRR